jgi:hypothetical protein
MGKVVLFAAPRVVPPLPWVPTEADIRRHGREAIQELQQVREIGRHIDNGTREKVSLLVSVLGLTHLTELCVDCALSEIIRLCERPDVYAVLDSYAQGKAAAKRKVG